MKKLILAAGLFLVVTGMTMAQTTPAHPATVKKATKTEVAKTSATAAGKHHKKHKKAAAATHAKKKHTAAKPASKAN